MSSNQRERPSGDDGIGNTPAMWRQTFYFLVIPALLLFGLLWLTGN